MDLRRGCRRFRLRRGFRAPAALAGAVLISFLAAAAPGAAAGAQWTPISPDLGTATALAFDPRGSGTVYAAAADGQVLRSADRGASWARAGVIAAAGGHIRSLVVSPGDPGLLYAGAPGGFFRSTDGGATLTALALPGPLAAAAIDPVTPRTLYAAIAPGQGPILLKSTDGGASWRAAARRLPLGAAATALGVDPASPSTVYLATDRGVFVTRNGGRSWTRLNAGLEGVSVATFAFLPGLPGSPPTVYAGSDRAGIFLLGP
jgi:photosystem II stability/assembly factor-like uncharacterized protein